MSQYACKRNIIFYHKVVEAVIAILSGTAPCLILENPTQVTKDCPIHINECNQF
ncbi:UNVERIFIED_CONTAM: hypothetical protein NCL1_46818 [Trichonephila clavipes]